MLNILIIIFYFFIRLINVLFVFIPVAGLFSWTRRNMFNRSAALYFFMMAFFICFLWRFLYVFNTSFMSRRYIAFLIIFFIIIAVPGFCFIMDAVSALIRGKYDIKRNHIILVLVLLISIISITKGIYTSGKKTFIKETGVFIENYCRQNSISNFVLLDGTGNDVRMAFYAKALEGKVIYIGGYKNTASGYIANVDGYINYHKYNSPRQTVLLILKAKSAESFFDDYHKYSISKYKFNLLNVFPDRKYEYFLLVVN